MKKIIFFTLFFISIVTCASAYNKIDIITPGAGFSDAINLTGDDSGATIEARQGQLIIITLSQGDSGGYRWYFIDKPDPQVLNFLTLTYTIPSVERIFVEDRLEIWKFKAVGTGATSFRIGLFKLIGVNKPPESEFVLTVTVK